MQLVFYFSIKLVKLLNFILVDNAHFWNREKLQLF